MKFDGSLDWGTQFIGWGGLRLPSETVQNRARPRSHIITNKKWAFDDLETVKNAHAITGTKR